MSHETSEAQQPDVVDRFFGFTEELICGKDYSTANVQLDPAVLERESKIGVFGCGVEATESSEESSQEIGCCGAVSNTLDTNCRGPEPVKSSGSQDGSIETSTSTVSKQRRRKIWSFFRCNGKERLNDVVVHD